MTVTLDTKALSVEGGGIEETVEPVGSFVDRWINGEYKKEAKIFGAVRSWAIRCYENNVAWSGSTAKYLKERAKAGNKVSFSIEEGNLHSVSSTYVYILVVDVAYRKGSKAASFIRNFTLRLQEAPP